MIKKTGYVLNKRDKWLALAFVFIIILGSFLELLAVSIFSPFIDLIMGTLQDNESTILSILRKIFTIEDDKYFLVILSVIIICIYVIKDVYTISEKSLIYRYAYSIQRRISTDLLKAYMKEPYTFHLNKNISVLQRSLQIDIEKFASGLLHVMELIAEIFVCVSLFIYLFYVSHSLTVIIGVLLVICVGSFYLISKKYSCKWGIEAQQYSAKVYQWMNQSIGGVKELKVLNRENNFIANYNEQMGNYVRVLRYSRIIGVVPKYIIEMVSMVGMLLAVIVKLLFGQRDDIAVFVPQLAVFAVAALRLIPSVGRINEHLAAVLGSIPSLDLIYNDIREVENVPDAQYLRDDNWEFKDNITVRNLSYHYPESDVMVIENASFDIRKGQTAAFIGPSGAGKSTTIDILLGLLTPVKGKVFADDLDVFKNLPTWQKEIGYIPQTIYLSDDSIRNNIAFGVPSNEIDENAIVVALKKAQLYEFVESLPEGLDTFVGDRGVRISGGQRQRIGIARALYHDPEVLVLDEATSALDTETESAVMEAIDSLKGEKTILIIAHRLTTIKNADVVFEVSDGQIVEVRK